MGYYYHPHCLLARPNDYLDEKVDPGDYAVLEFNRYRCQKRGSRKKCPHEPDCGPRRIHGGSGTASIHRWYVRKSIEKMLVSIVNAIWEAARYHEERLSKTKRAEQTAPPGYFLDRQIHISILIDALVSITQSTNIDTKECIAQQCVNSLTILKQSLR